MPPMRTTSSRRASKRTAKKRTNPKRKYTNTFKRLTKEQYHKISTRNPSIPYPDELGPLAQAPKIRDHLYRIRASYVADPSLEYLSRYGYEAVVYSVHTFFSPYSGFIACKTWPGCRHSAVRLHIRQKSKSWQTLQ